MSLSISRSLSEIRDPKCRLCPLSAGATKVCVPGEGSARLPVMILGEAPGREEDARGRPFVGRSGKLLRSTLYEVGVPYRQCYLTNTVKCYPKGTPTDAERNTCSRAYLKKEISALNPSLILALGRVAASALLPGDAFSEVRGQINHSWLGDALVFPVWHPAYLLRNGSKIPEWRNDLEDFSLLLKLELGLLK